MFYPTAIFLSLIISITAASAALLIVAVSNLQIFKKYNLLLKEQERLKLQDNKKELEILEHARHKAAEIIGTAHIIDNNTKNEFQEQLKTLSVNETKDFEKSALDLLKVYKQELEDLKFNTVKIVNNITKDIEKNTEGELKDFEEILKKETYGSQKIVEQKIEEDYANAQKAIQDYKTERIKKVEDDIYNIIQNVSKAVLGKTIELKDHEQLVIDALTKAKEKSVF